MILKDFKISYIYHTINVNYLNTSIEIIYFLCSYCEIIITNKYTYFSL
jgi:hypothetical protein